MKVFEKWSRVLIASVALTTAGCAAESADADDAVVESEAAVTTPASALAAFEGRWTFHSSRLEMPRDLGEAVRVAVDPAARGPDGEAWGTTLTLYRVDHPTVRLRDRAPFARVGEKRDCSNVKMGGGKSVTICHEARLEGAELVHTVTMRDWTYLIPGSSSSATQRLSIEGSRLRYRYEIDGELVEDFVFAR